MVKVLFVCTGNSCRSQMAEGLAARLGAGRIEAESAGSAPASRVSPHAVKVMAEEGLDISAHEPKSLQRFLGRDFDYVITLCDSARQVCPVFPGGARHLHWSIPDPMPAVAGEEEALAIYRKTRDLIGERLEEFLDSL